MHAPAPATDAIRPRHLPLLSRGLASLFRRIPVHVRGKTRAARHLLPLPRGVHEIELGDGSRLFVPDLREPVAFLSLINGQYEPETLETLQRLMGDGGLFVDVGANVGAMTLPMARWLGRRGEVVAIEGNPSIARLLSAAIEHNRVTNVVLHTLLCGESAGTVPFYEAPEAHFGMGSRGPQFDVAPVDLPMKTLDEILASSQRRPRVIKIDVEGFELQALQGAERILAEDRPAIVFEFCDWAEERNPNAKPGEAQAFLMERGYRLQVLESASGEKGPLRSPMTHGSAMIVATATA